MAAEVQMNGNALHNGGHREVNHQEPSLEDSIASLLSNSERSRLTDETKATTSNYRKSAKLFINKKFQESFKIVHDHLISDSFALLNSAKIDEHLFINIWSLYFNLIDIFLNKSLTTLPKMDRDLLVDEFQSEEIFTNFYKLDSLVHPKLILLLLLIKLNNEQTDLAKLRHQADMYLANISTEITHDNRGNSKERSDSFQELLEIYHIYLLPKLNEFEESEYLIKTNPLIENPDELVSKLKQTKIDMENKEKQRQELAKRRELEAQRRKEQQLREEEEIRRNKEIERARAEAIALSERNHNSKISKRSSLKKNDTDKGFSDSSIYLVLKDRLLNNNVIKTLTNSKVLILVFSLISLIALANSRKIVLNRKLREILGQFWDKLSNTLKMAFQVTYM